MKTKYNLPVAIAAFMALPASAEVIYEQAWDGVFGYISDFDSVQIADDFVLQPGAATITDIHWWGAYAQADTPQPLDDFTILIWADDGGTPDSAPILNLHVHEAGRTDTGSDIGSWDVYSYSVDIAPLALNAGTTYWLSILNDTTGDLDDDWIWARHSTSDGLFRIPASTDGDTPDWSNGASVAYQLTNDNLVPEPATMSLLGLGLAGLAFRRRNRH